MSGYFMSCICSQPTLSSKNSAAKHLTKFYSLKLQVPRWQKNKTLVLVLHNNLVCIIATNYANDTSMVPADYYNSRMSQLFHHFQTSSALLDNLFTVLTATNLCVFYAPWFFLRLWRFVNHLLTYLLTNPRRIMKHPRFTYMESAECGESASSHRGGRHIVATGINDEPPDCSARYQRNARNVRNAHSWRNSRNASGRYVRCVCCISASMVSVQCKTRNTIIEFVSSLVCKLKCRKAAGYVGLTAEHIVYAHPILIVLLSLLYQMLVLHGIVSTAFSQGIVIPLVKNTDGNIADSSNYCLQCCHLYSWPTV